MKTTDNLTFRQRATIKILFFIVKMLNPTGYTHEIDNLQTKLEKELAGDETN